MYDQDRSPKTRAETIKADFLANDRATRQQVLRRRGFREIAYPWSVTHHVSVYERRNKTQAKFVQGARVR